MQTSGFLKPRIIDVQGIAPNHAKVVMEPFERGYGHPALFTITCSPPSCRTAVSTMREGQIGL